MQTAQTVLTAFTVAAGLSLGIERGLELLKHFMDLGNGSLNPKEGIQRAAELVDKAEQALAHPESTLRAPGVAGGAQPGSPGGQPRQGPAVNRTAADSEASEKYPPPRIPVVPMAALSTQDTGNTLFFQFAGAGLGIFLANVFELRLLSVLLDQQPQAISALFALADGIFTGLVIGGGSQPIHVLIRFLSERKVTVASEEAVEDAEGEVEKTKALAKVVSSKGLISEKKEQNPLEWVDIVYTGGVDPQQLDNQHLRSGKPNLVVYHHTAMSSASSFQDVVDEFLVTKKWLTGYHCVVMPDGAIKPFCRWDRSGSHAKGLNDRSLGISFHGNFHTEAGEQFSNADGRFGNQRPTEAQLHAGARVVALWAYLYQDIKLDRILPHKKAMPGHTVCPGSNFPCDQFETLVRQYHDAWSHSTLANKGVEQFKQLNYVYA